MGRVTVDAARRPLRQVGDIQFEILVGDATGQVLMLESGTQRGVDDPGTEEREDEDADTETDRPPSPHMIGRVRSRPRRTK